jgi:hypothetical protein
MLLITMTKNKIMKVKNMDADRELCFYELWCWYTMQHIKKTFRLTTIENKVVDLKASDIKSVLRE